MLFETFHSLQETLVDFARTHADWLAPLGFAFAFLKSLPLVALVIPGTALLLSIGAILGLGDAGFVPVWLAIAVGADSTGSPSISMLGVLPSVAIRYWIAEVSITRASACPEVTAR